MAVTRTKYVQVLGVEELEKTFKTIPDNIRKAVIKTIARKAAKPVQKAARRKLSTANRRKLIKVYKKAGETVLPEERTGLTAKTIVIKSTKRTRNKNKPVGVRVVTDPQKIIGNQSYYAYRRKGGKSFILNPNWLEYGVPWHKNWHGALRPLPPNPFMRPAIEEAKFESMNIFTTELRKMFLSARALGVENITKAGLKEWMSVVS